MLEHIRSLLYTLQELKLSAHYQTMAARQLAAIERQARRLRQELAADRAEWIKAQRQPAPINGLQRRLLNLTCSIDEARMLHEVKASRKRAALMQQLQALGDKSLREAAEILGVSHETVRRCRLAMA